MITNMSKTILAAAVAAALTITTATAFAGGTAPQATGTGDYSSVCTDTTGAGCAPLAQFDAAQATGFSSVALGWWSMASGTGALALGDYSVASGSTSTAVGTSASAAGTASTALGASANASGDQATALGVAAQATAYESTAVGTGAHATSEATTAVGDGAAASGAGSTAIGTLASAVGSGSVALGSGSVANRPDTVSVGNAASGLDRQISNVAAGTMPTDAANVSQVQQAESQAINTSENYTNSALAPINGQISALGLAVSQLGSRLNGLGAAEQASAQMAMACAGDRNCIAAGWGLQGGQGAVALGFRHQVFHGRAAWTAGVSNSQAGTSVGAGFAIRFGN